MDPNSMHQIGKATHEEYEKIYQTPHSPKSASQKGSEVGFLHRAYVTFKIFLKKLALPLTPPKFEEPSRGEKSTQA